MPHPSRRKAASGALALVGLLAITLASRSARAQDDARDADADAATTDDTVTLPADDAGDAGSLPPDDAAAIPTIILAPSRLPIPSGRVLQVRIEPSLPGEDPWARVGLHPGDVLDEAGARAALRAALESGTFAEARGSVRNIHGGLELLVEGERRVRLAEAAFVGVSGRAIENVRQDFGIRNGTWVTGLEVARASERLRDNYVNAGFAHTVITTRWRETDDPAARVLIVDVTEGVPTRVRAIGLEGVPPEVAEPVRSVLGLAPGDIADPLVVRRVSDPIAAELRRAGYLTATLQPVRFVTVGAALVDVLVSVRAGPKYRLEWVGTSPFPSTALETALRLEEERTLDPTTRAAMVTRVREAFLRHGYLDAQVRIEERAEPGGTSVLRFVVDRRDRVVVRAVNFPGAEHLAPSSLADTLHELLENELPFGEYAVLEGHERETPAGSNPHPEGELAGGPGFLWVYPQRTYLPDLYADAARRMIARYREAGFLDATVAAPQAQRVDAATGTPSVDVSFEVTEGPRTFLDEVIFDGNRSFASEVLAGQLEIRLGVPLSYPALDTARTTLSEYYREQGHLFARIEPQVERSPNRTRARVRFVVHEGPEVRVGHVIVRGNLRTEEWVIAQRVELHPGGVFRPSLVRNTQRRLGETGFFSGVTVTPVDPEVEAPVKDILVQVLEVRPQYLDLRAGFSTGEGLRAGMDYGYRNVELFGLGFTAAFSAQLGYQIFIAPGDPVYQQNYSNLSVGDRLRHRLSLSFLVPAIERLGRSFRGTVDIGEARVIERQFALVTGSGGVSLTFRPVRQFQITGTTEVQISYLQILGETTVDQILASTLADRTMSGAVERLAHLLLLPKGTTYLAAARITASIDRRDQVFNPTRGLFATATAEYVQTLGYDPGVSLVPVANPPRPGNTLRFLASVSGYVPLPAGIVFATNLRAGLNYTFGDGCAVTYTNRLFFLGGADSMRAWLQDTFVPQDVVDSINGYAPSRDTCQSAGAPINLARESPQLIALTQRGGDLFFNWRNELRVPISTTGFALGAFVDLGNLWKDWRSGIRLAVRAAIGVGLRYNTPIGPVALDVGFNPAPQSFEVPWAFQFSIGLF